MAGCFMVKKKSTIWHNTIWLDGTNQIFYGEEEEQYMADFVNQKQISQLEKVEVVEFS